MRSEAEAKGLGGHDGCRHARSGGKRCGYPCRREEDPDERGRRVGCRRATPGVLEGDDARNCEPDGGRDDERESCASRAETARQAPHGLNFGEARMRCRWRRSRPAIASVFTP
jgi:hypothetical protein